VADEPDQSDLYRRIDDLLSKPTDEQVREQRALNDLMVGVRDAIARLTGDVAALAARVSETREFTEQIADRPAPAPAAAPGPPQMPADMARRLETLETAIGELAALVAAAPVPATAAEAPDLGPLVHVTIPEAIRGAVPGALRDVLGAAVPDAVRDAVEGQLSRLGEAAGAERGDVTAAVNDAIANLRGTFVSALEATRGEVRTSVDQLRDALGSSSSELRTSLGTSSSDLRDSLGASLTELRDTLGTSTTELRDALGASSTELRDSLARSVDALRARVDEAASAGLRAGDVQELIDKAFSQFSARLDEVRTRSEALAETLAAIEEGMGERLGVVASAADVAGVREQLGAFSKISMDVAALRTALSGTVDLPAAVDRAITEGRDAMQEAIDAIAEQIRTDASNAADRVRSEAGVVLEKTTSLAQSATERLGEASTLALARIGEVGSTAFERLQDAAEAIERETSKVPRAVRDVASRMDEFQETMLAYLAARDLALEEARDRVLQELLDEYASGLSQRQRAGLGTGLRRAFRRRKDKRDAEKYRSGPTEDVPKMPEVSPDAVERAATAIAERARAATAQTEAKEPVVEAAPVAPKPKPKPAPAPAPAKAAAPTSVKAPVPKPAATKKPSAQPKTVVPAAKPAPVKPEPTKPPVVKPAATPPPAVKPTTSRPPAVKPAASQPPAVKPPADKPAEPKPAESVEPKKAASIAGVGPTPEQIDAMEYITEELAHLPGAEPQTEGPAPTATHSSKPVVVAPKKAVSPKETSKPAKEPPKPAIKQEKEPMAAGKTPKTPQAKPRPTTAVPAKPTAPQPTQAPDNATPVSTIPSPGPAAKARSSTKPKVEAKKPDAKPKPPAKKAKGSEGSLAEKFAADAKRTADRLAAESKAREEAARQARTENAGATGTSRDEED
jgi:hypothetical protein